MVWIRWTVLLSVFATFTSLAAAQNVGDIPNPYHEIQNWVMPPGGRMWGAVFGAGIDSHGNVWVLERCGGSACADSNVAPILEFDSSGKYLKGIGQGMFAFPHGFKIDKDDNLWVTDAGTRNGKGNQVVKLSPEGKVLLTLGKKGVMGGGPDNFIGPSDLTVAPNGDIFVADGHAVEPSGGGESLGFQKQNNSASHMRIAKFSKDGKFIKEWGKLGSAPGEFYAPHGIAIDSQGRLFVADRGNNRIQIFDQDGKLLGIWKQFGKPCSLFIDGNDTLYVIDSDSVGGLWNWKYSSIGNPCPTCLLRVPRLTDVGLPSLDFTQGIRIGSAKDGVVKALIPPHVSPWGPTTIPQYMTVDALGNLYVADADTRSLRKYVKKVELPEGPGKEMVQRACVLCHDFSEFPRVNFDHEDWAAAVNTMVAGGAALKKEEIPIVVDYLAANFKGGNASGVAVPGKVQATITEWDIPTPNSMPYGIVHSPRSGFTWYTGQFANVMGRFDPKTEQFKEYHLRPGTNPSSLLEISETNFLGVIFFASQAEGLIGQFHPRSGPYPTWEEGDVLEHPIPGPKLLLHEVAIAPHGLRLWFTVTEAKPPVNPDGSKLGSLQIRTNEIKLLDAPTSNAAPYGLAVNSEGVPFFTEKNSPKLGSVDPVTMQVTEYPLPNSGSGPRGITTAPDDTVWYTDYLRGYLGRFDPKTGKFTEWASPSGPRSLPNGITHVGNIIWYAEAGTKPNMLVRFDPKTEKFQSWPVKSGGGIRNMYGDADGSLWFTRPLTNGIAHVTIKEE